MDMYRQMHSSEAESLPQRDDLGPESFERDEAPSETFLLLLQTTIRQLATPRQKRPDSAVDVGVGYLDAPRELGSPFDQALDERIDAQTQPLRSKCLNHTLPSWPLVAQLGNASGLER